MKNILVALAITVSGIVGISNAKADGFNFSFGYNSYPSRSSCITRNYYSYNSCPRTYISEYRPRIIYIQPRCERIIYIEHQPRVIYVR